MGKEEKRLDISQVVAAPVLIGPTNLPMWTGVVRTEEINQYLIRDDMKREAFLKLVKEFERCIIEYRDFDSKKSPVLNINQIRIESEFEKEQRRKAIENKIRELSREIKMVLNNPDNGIDMDLFWIYLCYDYEKILKENRAEFSHMREDAKKSLKKFKKKVDSREILFRELYNPTENEYRVVSFFTEEQSRKYSKGEKNPSRLVKLVTAITGKEKVTLAEGMRALEDIFESIYLSDYFTIFTNEKYSKLQYLVTYKNYLLRRGDTTEQIEAMDIDSLSEKVLETYDAEGVEHHKALVGQAIKYGVKYLDLEKAILIACMRHLNALEGIRVQVKEVAPDEESEIESQSENGIICENVLLRAHGHEEVADRVKRTEQLLRTVLDQKIISPAQKVSIVINGEYKEISVKDIEDVMVNFCDGVYITDQLIEAYKYKALIDDEEMSSWSDELFQRMEFKDRDIIVLSLINLKNLKRLYETGKIDKDSIIMLLSIIENGSLREVLSSGDILEEHEEQVAKMLRNSSNILSFLFFEGIIDFSDLKKFYDMRVIRIDDLEKIESEKTSEEQLEFRKELGKQVSYKDLLVAYKDYIEHKLIYENALRENDSDIDIYKDTMEIKRREKESLLMFFKKYKLADLSADEKTKIINEVFIECLEFENEITTELLRDMYKDGIMSLENISDFDKDTDFEFSVTNYIFARGELNLNDNDKFRESLSPEVLKKLIQSILANPEITRSQKFTLIMNVYTSGTKADIDMINGLWNDMNIASTGESILTKEQENILKSRKKKEVKPKHEKRSGNIEWVYPKTVKWKFLKALDKDAEVKIYADGYVEMYSKKLGVRIIERYFEDDNFKIDAYGYSTFVIKDNTYRENINKILGKRVYRVQKEGKVETVIEDVLIREILSELVPKEDRIRHNTKSSNKNWMREMARYFEIDLETDIDLVNDTRYTKEELESLRSTIKMYENARVER